MQLRIFCLIMSSNRKALLAGAGYVHAYILLVIASIQNYISSLEDIARLGRDGYGCSCALIGKFVPSVGMWRLAE